MTCKATAQAPSNIAFVKYMGRKDDVLRLPENASISMNLSGLHTKTTVHFSGEYSKDSFLLDGESEAGEDARVIKHLDRIRALAKIDLRAKVVSENSFPKGTGLSSSASGFAALTVAGAAASGLRLSERELSILARQGSGSACRSIPDGFVIWRDAETSEESVAESLYPPSHWDIADVVAVVHSARKQVSTTQTHRTVTDGPYYHQRLSRMRDKVAQCLRILKNRDFDALATFIEEEALDLHAIFMTAGIIHLDPNTLDVMKRVPVWRAEGLPVAYTVNTGQDVHLLCPTNAVDDVTVRLRKLPFVREIIVNAPAAGTRLIDDHLF